MRRTVRLPIDTDESGEFCDDKCPQLTPTSGRCKAFFRAIKFRPIGDTLVGIRLQLCKKHEVVEEDKT